MPDEHTVRALEALGYLPTTPAENPEDRGITRHDRERASPGLNLFGSRRRPSALLLDMEGGIVHRWDAGDDAAPGTSWMHVEPLPGGELLVIVKDRHLSKRDWRSNLVWRLPIRAHHDLAVHESGRLLVLVREPRRLRYRGGDVPILADGIALLSASGTVERVVWLTTLLRDHISSHRLARVRDSMAAGGSSNSVLHPGGVGDVLHTNSIELLDRDIPGVAPAGSVLLSFRAISRIAILDAGLEQILWMWGEGELDAQHDVTQLENGNLLLFDNGMRRGRSRVIEVDAAAGRVVRVIEPPGLFSRIRGGAQQLPNGNVLITESDRGHALEVAPSGEPVWELWNPDLRRRGNGTERGVIYRLNRFPAAYFAPLHR